MEQLISALKRKDTKSGTELYPPFPKIEFKTIADILSGIGLQENITLVNSQTLLAESLTVEDSEFPDGVNIIRSIIKIGQTTEELQRVAELSGNIVEIGDSMSTSEDSALKIQEKKEKLQKLKLEQREILTRLGKGCHYVYIEIDKNGEVYIFDSWKDTIFANNDEMRRTFWNDDVWNDQTGKFHFVSCPQQDASVGHCSIFSLRNCVMMDRLRRIGNSREQTTADILQKITPLEYKREFDGEAEANKEWLKIIELCNKTGKHTIGNSIAPVTHTSQSSKANSRQLI